MTTRRKFLKSTAAIAATSLLSTSGQEASASDTAREGKKIVPDTLDLADHGRLAVNGMLGSLDPAVDSEAVFLHILDVHPVYMLHWSTMVSGVMPKYLEALPMLRAMSGSEQDVDLEKGFIEAMVRNAEGDGLVYDRADESRPWNVGVYYGKPDWNEDYANMAGNGRLISAFTFWHQVTGDDVWKKRSRKAAERMLELAIQDGQYAFYPNPGLGNDFSYPRETGWTTDKPPERHNEGFEGATLFYLFQPLRGFSRYYRLSGDERFLELSKKFVNFGIQPKFWGGAHDVPAPAGAERGHFKGHFHGTLAALRGMLDYAVLADDTRVKLMVRDAYEWARQMGIHRLGLFTHNGEQTEGCAIGDMVGLAVQLIDAGLGDYWDDVEMYTRNGLVSAQATDKEELNRVSEEGKHRPPQSDWGGHFDTRFGGNNKGVLPQQEIHDRAMERTIGAFGHIWGARYQVPQMMSCCTANCSQGLYFAWEGIIRNDGRTADVNMWLNRRSLWVDVWSGLPYEGKLVVQNKGMSRITIRKPSWTRASKVRCRINGSDAEPTWSGNRMVFGGLTGNEELVVETAVTQDSGTYTMVNLQSPQDSKEQYACEFKGHTALSAERIQAGAQEGDFNWYRLFRRDEMRADRAPTKEQSDYVHPEKIVKWTIG